MSIYATPFWGNTSIDFNPTLVIGQMEWTPLLPEDGTNANLVIRKINLSGNPEQDISYVTDIVMNAVDEISALMEE
jgi:hypothetical protein